MTKAARIIELHRQGVRPREIAAACDCRPEYVRVVLNQRGGSRSSDIDRRYQSSPRGLAKRREHARRRAVATAEPKAGA